MKHKKLLLAALAVTGVLVLTACSSSNKNGAKTTESGKANGSESSDTDRQGTAAQGAEGPQDISGVTVGGSTNSSSSGAAAGTDAGEGQSTVIQGTVVEDGGPKGDVIPDEDAASAENDTEDHGDASAGNTDEGWRGTYIGDDETVTVSAVSDNRISFTFTQSGISGSAVVEGDQAVYKGDDHYVIVFDLEGDILGVSVTNEEDYDASESPLIGTYVREQ